MEQLTISADEDVRIELGLPLGPLWVGKRWTDEEREEYMREKYANEPGGVNLAWHCSVRPQR